MAPRAARAARGSTGCVVAALLLLAAGPRPRRASARRAVFTVLEVGAAAVAAPPRVAGLPGRRGGERRPGRASLDEPTVGQLAFPVAVYSVARWSPRWQGVAALPRRLRRRGGRLGPLAGRLRSASSPPAQPGAVRRHDRRDRHGRLGARRSPRSTRERYVASLVDARRAGRADGRARGRAGGPRRAVADRARDARRGRARAVGDRRPGRRREVRRREGPDVAVEHARDDLRAPGARRSPRCDGCWACCVRDGDTGVAPQPGLDDVRHLVDEARAAGMRSRPTSPEPPPDGAGRRRAGGVPDRAGGAHQRAQARRPATRRRTCASRSAAAVEVEVRDDGRGAAAPADGRGLGLVGMRERVGRARRDARGRARAGRRVRGVCEAAAVSDAVTHGTIRVFLVDDQQMVRAGFRMLVESQDDMEVVGEAGDGGEALRAARGHRGRRRADGRPDAAPRRGRGDRGGHRSRGDGRRG